MFRDNHGHPSDITALLVSCCHMTAIYQRSPEGLPVAEKLKDHAQAGDLVWLLQKIAWGTVAAHPLSRVKA